MEWPPRSACRTCSMLRPRRHARLRPAGLRAGSRRQLLCDDLLEQRGVGCAEGERAGVHALLGEFGIARGIERGTRLARVLDPSVELLRRHRADLEMHTRETIAAIMARQALESAG